MEVSSPCLLESLPPEILLQVVKQVTDPGCLNRLLCASPVIFRLFSHGHNSFEMVEAALSDVTHTTPAVRSLMETVGLFRSGSMPVWTLHNFLEDFVARSVMGTSRPMRPRILPSLPKHVQPAVLRSLLQTASRIHDLTQHCLYFYLARLRGIQPRLRKPVDPSFSYVGGYGPDEALVPAWQRRCEGVPYPTPEMGPPSWAEEQIVVRAFWRLQLFFDVKRAARAGRLGGWSALDLEALGRMNVKTFLRLEHIRQSPVHEVLTVLDYLHELGVDDSRLELPVTESRHAVEARSIPYSAYYQKSPAKLLKSAQRSAVVKRGGVQLDSPRAATSEGMLMAYSISISNDSPIKGIDVMFYRRLGFGIWDNRRLAALGLANKPQDDGQNVITRQPVYPPECYWFQWRSMLSSEVIEEIEKKYVTE